MASPGSAYRVPYPHLSGRNGAFIEFAVTQYQFPAMKIAPENHDDLNWVRVQFRVSDGQRVWSRDDPAWLTTDLPRLAAWLRQTASGQQPAYAWTALEPLLTLVCESATRTIELNAELRLELQPEDAKMSQALADDPETVRLTPTREELITAAAVVDEAFHRLPPR
jgi:hypothetical protein